MYTRSTEQSKYGNCGIEFDLGFINTYTLILRYPCSDIGELSMEDLSTRLGQDAGRNRESKGFYESVDRGT